MNEKLKYMQNMHNSFESKCKIIVSKSFTSLLHYLLVISKYRILKSLKKQLISFGKNSTSLRFLHTQKYFLQVNTFKADKSEIRCVIYLPWLAPILIITKINKYS